MSVAEYKKKVKFVTGAADGTVKVWTGMCLGRESKMPVIPTQKVIHFNVSRYAVTALVFMSGSKRLAIAT